MKDIAELLRLIFKSGVQSIIICIILAIIITLISFVLGMLVGISDIPVLASITTLGILTDAIKIIFIVTFIYNLKKL